MYFVLSVIVTTKFPVDESIFAKLKEFPVNKMFCIRIKYLISDNPVVNVVNENSCKLFFFLNLDKLFKKKF